MSRLCVLFDVACVVCVWLGHAVWTDVLSVCAHVGYVCFCLHWVHPAVSAHSLVFPWR